MKELCIKVGKWNKSTIFNCYMLILISEMRNFTSPLTLRRTVCYRFNKDSVEHSASISELKNSPTIWRNVVFPARWKQSISPKHLYLLTSRHNVASQKNLACIDTTLRILNGMYFIIVKLCKKQYGPCNKQ